jgi:MinD superfamily P-loop ATPase
MIPVIDKTVCTECGACVEVCPPRALVMRSEKVFLEEEFCEECGFCGAECPADAIKIDFPKKDRPRPG